MSNQHVQLNNKKENGIKDTLLSPESIIGAASGGVNPVSLPARAVGGWNGSVLGVISGMAFREKVGVHVEGEKKPLNVEKKESPALYSTLKALQKQGYDFKIEAATGPDAENAPPKFIAFKKSDPSVRMEVRLPEGTNKENLRGADKTVDTYIAKALIDQMTGQDPNYRRDGFSKSSLATAAAMGAPGGGVGAGITAGTNAGLQVLKITGFPGLSRDPSVKIYNEDGKHVSVKRSENPELYAALKGLEAETGDRKANHRFVVNRDGAVELRERGKKASIEEERVIAKVDGLNLDELRGKGIKKDLANAEIVNDERVRRARDRQASAD